MKHPVRAFLLILLLLHGLPGCGFEPTLIIPTLSLCGMACVVGLSVESRLDLTIIPEICELKFQQFEGNHPSSVCGHHFGVVFASECVGAALLGAALALVCLAVCSENPDIGACATACLLEEMELEGSCILCYVKEAIDFRLCLLKPSITSQEIDTCVSKYIWQSSLCNP